MSPSHETAVPAPCHEPDHARPVLWSLSRVLLAAPFFAVLTGSLLLASVCARAQASEQPTPQVLVLNSYHPGYSWSDGELQGVLRVLMREHPGVVPHVEYLDARQDPELRYAEQILRFIRAKHGEHRFDAIVTLDDAALQFALDYRSRLGESTPIVFGGVNSFRPESLGERRDVTGVVEAFDFVGNIELILTLRPQTKRIILVSDSSETSRLTRQALEPILPRYAGRVGFEDLTDWTAEELLEKVARLPSNTTGLVLGDAQDVTGRLVSEDETFLHSLASRSSVPLFMVSQPYLPLVHGYGWDRAVWFGVGGHMLSSDSHGESVGLMASRVLRGVPVSAIPVLRVSPTRLAFDYAQIVRHRMDPSRLPPEAELFGRTETFLQRYRVHILATLGLVVGLCIIIAALVLNIARRRRAERNVIRSNERFHLLARATNDAVWDLDLSTDTLWWNEHLPEILGWPPDTPASRTRWIDAIHQDDREDVVARLFSSAPDRPNPLVLEHRFVRFDGSVGHAMLRAFCLRDPQGGLRRLVGSMLDLTERKRREDELRLRNQELERFTYTVSHDLKSPLITIRGFAGSMRNDLAAGRVDRLPGDVDRIALAANKMSHLLDDLLELSRIGRVMNPPVDVCLEELARDALALLAGRIEESRANVVVASGLPTVRGDRQRLLEVIQNLVENALKFARAGVPPSVEIGARTTRGETVFYVADDGIGIAERDREAVFSLFTKLDPQSEGTGIGLALVRRIVEVHGGRIWVESDGIGHGATFCFTLPAPSDS